MLPVFDPRRTSPTELANLPLSQGWRGAVHTRHHGHRSSRWTRTLARRHRTMPAESRPATQPPSQRCPRRPELQLPHPGRRGPTWPAGTSRSWSPAWPPSRPYAPSSGRCWPGRDGSATARGTLPSSRRDEARQADSAGPGAQDQKALSRVGISTRFEGGFAPLFNLERSEPTAVVLCLAWLRRSALAGSVSA